MGYQIHWTLHFCPWASLHLPKDKTEGGMCQLGVSARGLCASNKLLQASGFQPPLPGATSTSLETNCQAGVWCFGLPELGRYCRAVAKGAVPPPPPSQVWPQEEEEEGGFHAMGECLTALRVQQVLKGPDHSLAGATKRRQRHGFWLAQPYVCS